MYALADKYDIETLRQAAQKKFDKSILSESLTLNEIPEIVEIVYTTTPSSDRGLRKSVTTLLVRHKTALLAHAGFVNLIKNRLDGEFALDLIHLWCGKRVSSSEAIETSCPICEVGTLKGMCRNCEPFGYRSYRRVRYQGHGTEFVCSVCGEQSVEKVHCDKNCDN